MKVPFLLYLAHSVLSIFKIALKMVGKIASKLAHSENESCLLRTAAMAVLTFEVMFDAVSGNGKLSFSENLTI